MNRLLNFNPKLVTESLFKDIDHSIINLGRCFIWAYSAHLIFANVKLCAVECHAFVKYKGKFYDSDRPNGVLNWKKLPANGFSMRDTYSVYQPTDFKREWHSQTLRFKTSWKEIERRALDVLRRKHYPYEEPSKIISSGG